MSDRLSSLARLRFLGAKNIEIGNEVVTPESERLFAMIVRLSVPLGRITSRQTMMDTLWPGFDDANARHNLRQTVYKAREIGLVIESGEDGLRLDPRHWSCDWDDPVGDVGGEWLSGYEPEFSEELVAWVASQRLGVHALIRPRIIRSLQNARSAGDLQSANRYAIQLLGIDTLNEEATLTRAEVMAMHGAKVDALKLLDSYIAEIGKISSGRDAALPALLLRRRIAEKLPTITYQTGSRHHGPLVGRVTESRLLTAGLFDARAGRGNGYLVHGPEGSGKSRLLHEMRMSAVLQGMRVLDYVCSSEPSATPFTTMRALVQRLLELPGALGVAPEALAALRAWVVSREFAPDDCPLAEIEDLLAAVSEDTPLVLHVEHAERIDAETLGRLDRVYRKGVTRHHVMVLTSATHRTPAESPVTLQWITPVPLRPMTTVDVRSVITAWAQSERPLATQDQIACAAVFAEGIPMYGIEMLGLILDPGSPDVIPWRVQVAVERAVRELSEVQWRVLALAQAMGSAAYANVIRSSILDEEAFARALDQLEYWGSIVLEDGILRPSPLLADASDGMLSRSLLREDSLRAAEQLKSRCTSSFDAQALYGLLRLYLRGGQPTQARIALDTFTGLLLRADSAPSIVFELERISAQNTDRTLKAAIEEIVDQVKSGAESCRRKRPRALPTQRPASLPIASAANTELEFRLASNDLYAESMRIARDPNLPSPLRLAEAVSALMIASNKESREQIEEAFRAANAVRHSSDINPFDAARADTIFFASTGSREHAIASAHKLTEASRAVADVQLACKGLRNAAEVFSHYGASDVAQAVLHEARRLAFALGYHTQVIYTDVRLAELCLEQMDTSGAKAYLNSAQEIVVKNRVHAPLIEANIQSFASWEALISGDIQRAQRSARAVVRRLASAEKSGTALWLLLCAKLATRRGAFTKEVQRDISLLKSSIGDFPFNRNENMSMATLLLTTQGTPLHHEMSEFVRSQFPRIQSLGREIWPMINRALSS